MKSMIVTITSLLVLLFVISCNLMSPETDEPVKDPITTGSVPKGIWYSIDSSTIINFADPDIFILEYNKEFKFIDTTTMTFSVSVTKDSLFVTDPETESTMAIPFSYSGDTLIVYTPDDTLKLLAYTGPMPPNGWEMITGTTGTHTNGIPKDAWMNVGTEPNNLLIFGTNKLLSFNYDSYMGSLKLDTITFTLNTTKDTVYATMSDGAKDTVLMGFKGDTLIITTDKIMKYLPYTGPILPESWQNKINKDSGTVIAGVPGGNYITTATQKNMIISFSPDKIKLFEYDYSLKNLTIREMSFTFNKTKDTLFTKDPTGTKTEAISYKWVNDTLILTTPDKIARSVVPYKGVIPYPDWSNAQDSTKDTSFINLPLGKWRAKTALGDEILLVEKDLMKVLMYNPTDSTMSDSAISFTPSIKGDTLYILTKTGKDVITWSITPTATGKTLKLSTPKGVKEYSLYTGPVPPTEWILKGQTNDTTFINLPFGTWRGKTGNGEEILFIDKDMMKLLMYNPIDSSMTDSALSFTPSNKGDTLFVTSKTGIDAVTWSITPTTTGKTLKLLTPNGVKEYEFYTGPIPPTEWILKGQMFNSINGEWISANSRDKIYRIFNDSLLEMIQYSAKDSMMQWYKQGYRVSPAGDSLLIYSDGSIPETYTMKHSGDTLVLGTEVFVRYMGKIPPEEWALKVQGEEPTYHSYIGYWLSQDSMSVASFGPMKATFFKNTSGLVAMERLNVGTMADGSITVNDATTKIMVTGKPEYGTIMIDGQEYTYYKGSTIPEWWSITGGDDLSFTKEPYIGSWFSTDSLSIVEILPTMIVSHDYEVNTKTMHVSYMDYIPGVNTFEIIENESIQSVPYSLSGGVLTVSAPEGPMSFTPYTGTIPHQNWK